MKSDPLIRSMRKARREYASTEVGRLEKLLAERSKWRRRLTIATNKLSVIDDRILSGAFDLAKTVDEKIPKLTK